jgi:hypothetical protein
MTFKCKRAEYLFPHDNSNITLLSLAIASLVSICGIFVIWLWIAHTPSGAVSIGCGASQRKVHAQAPAAAPTCAANQTHIWLAMDAVPLFAQARANRSTPARRMRILRLELRLRRYDAKTCSARSFGLISRRSEARSGFHASFGQHVVS